MEKKILFLIGLARFFVVFLIFQYPILATIASVLLDSFDAGIAYVAGLPRPQYTRYDKIMDYWWYVFIVIYCINLPIFPVILALFILRTIGQVLTVITTKEKFLFWFPNILERYFWLYLFSLIYPPLGVYFVGLNQILPILISVLIIVPQEYFLHIKKSSFYGGQRWPKSITQPVKRLKG